MWEPEREYKIKKDMADGKIKSASGVALKRTSSYVVLIKHPEAGWIMFDTGIGKDPRAEWTDYILENVPYKKEKHHDVKEQLSLLGLTPEDINAVITSHMHFDHIGNDSLFAKTADFYINAKEAEYTYKKVLGSNDRQDHGWIVREDVILERKKVIYFDGDKELYEGIEAVELPGHTPGQIGLIVHAEDETLFFTSDACKFDIDYISEDASVSDSPDEYKKSLKKIKDFRSKYNARLFYSHDDEFIETYKMIPEYYG